MISKRKFLEVLANSTLSIFLSQKSFADSITIQKVVKPRITLDIFIDNVEEDNLSKSFYEEVNLSSTPRIFENVLKKVGDFYGKYGFETTFNIERGKVEDSYKMKTSLLQENKLTVQ